MRRLKVADSGIVTVVTRRAGASRNKFKYCAHLLREVTPAYSSRNEQRRHSRQPLETEQVDARFQ